ncbi:Golgi-associated RAB2 interactor protein 5B isoform X2 [Prionailurus viverrinus]|uniref:Golgi-associated RAB2 interactor protein 5B isoform X2 n=1 Tax=Prionailurus viverrinus TaxID=61388 RepID=UPI001FF5F869|nr:Golgi-associated RAB2 interactor protein 5B isoform X2 [Prionailurus viverrinus]
MGPHTRRAAEDPPEGRVPAPPPAAHVTNRGAPVYVHHRTNRVTMGVAASQPGLVLPDILLIAQPPEGRECASLVLTRMLPLDLTHLYVHDLSSWRLKLRLATGRCYYLELDAPGNEAGFLFDRWIRLINLLQDPTTTWLPRTPHGPARDPASVKPPASTWRLQDQPQSGRGRSVMTVEPNFPYKMLTLQKQRKARTLKRKFKSQAVGDSVPLIWSQQEHAEPRKKSAEKKSQRNLHPDTSQTQIQVTEKPSITIRTVFSIVSNTINHTQSSSKCCSSDSDTATVLGGLIETPIRCVSADTPDISLLESYDPFNTYLWQQDVENLMDPDTSTLSSSSFSPATHPPRFSLPAAYSSSHRRNEKAQALGSGQRQRPPPSQKTAAARVAAWKVPFLRDQSKRVSAMHDPSQKMSTAPGPPRGPPVVPAVTQKTPTVHGPPWKAPHVSVTSRKAAASPGPARKAPPVSPTSRKAVSSSVPGRKSVFLPAPSQKALTSPTQQQMTPDAATLGTLPTGGPRGRVLERSQREGTPGPLMFVGTQEMDLIETRTQKTSQDLPFTTTKKESEEVVLTKALKITLDGLKGRGKLEDKVHRKKEEISLDKPGLTSQTVGQQQKWLKTQEVVIQGPPEEPSRPFSVEGLTLAKLMIMANSKEPPLRPATVNPSSWLSSPPMPDMSTVSPREVPLLQGTPEVVGEQSLFGTWVKERMHPWAEGSMYHWVESQPQVPKEASEVPGLPRHEASSLMMDNVSPDPISLPASRWEEVPPWPISLTPISEMKASVFQQPKRASLEPEGQSDQLEGRSDQLKKTPNQLEGMPDPLERTPDQLEGMSDQLEGRSDQLKKTPDQLEGMSDQSPLAITKLSSDVILPMLVENENMMDMAPEVEDIEEPGVYSPSASIQSSQSLH